MPHNKVGANGVAQGVDKNSRIHGLVKTRENPIEHREIDHRNHPREPRRAARPLISDLFVVDGDQDILEKTNQEKKNVLNDDTHTKN